MNEITITMDGGIIQDISAVKLDGPLRVNVMDFDIQDMDPNDLDVNEHGEHYYGTMWELP